MANSIKVDEGFIKEVQGVLAQLRTQIMQVKSGVNPNQADHTHGGHFNSLAVRPGGDKFESGASLKNKISSLGTSTDQKLSGFDTKLSGYSQGLDHILATSEATESANESYASFTGYLTGTGGASVPPPAIH
jgi:hypothetical protein